MKENVAGAFIGQVITRNGTNAMKNIRFFIANQHDVPDIAITDQGALYALRGLDREAKQNYSVTVIAETMRGLGVFQVSFLRGAFIKYKFYKFLILEEGTLPWATSCLGPSCFFLNERKINIFRFMHIALFLKVTKAGFEDPALGQMSNFFRSAFYV